MLRKFLVEPLNLNIKVKVSPILFSVFDKTAYIALHARCMLISAKAFELYSVRSVFREESSRFEKLLCESTISLRIVLPVVLSSSPRRSLKPPCMHLRLKQLHTVLSVIQYQMKQLCSRASQNDTYNAKMLVKVYMYSKRSSQQAKTSCGQEHPLPAARKHCFTRRIPKIHETGLKKWLNIVFWANELDNK